MATKPKRRVRPTIVRPTRKTLYPFKTLAVGQSFFIKGREKEAYIRTQASRLGGTAGIFFTVSRQEKNGRLGIKVERFQ